MQQLMIDDHDVASAVDVGGARAGKIVMIESTPAVRAAASIRGGIGAQSLRLQHSADHS